MAALAIRSWTQQGERLRTHATVYLGGREIWIAWTCFVRRGGQKLQQSCLIASGTVRHYV